MSTPKWKLLASPCPLRGSFRYARTGCWRSNGLTGHPYPGRTEWRWATVRDCVKLAPVDAVPDAFGVRAAIEKSNAEAMTAEAMNGLQRLLKCAVAVSMPPPSSGAQTAQSRRANRSLTALFRLRRGG